MDFELSEMVQPTLYAMFLNEAMELGVVHAFTTEGLRLALVALSWSGFEVWMSDVDHELRDTQLPQQAATGEVCGPSKTRKKARDQMAPRPL